jgi:lipoprotein-releasing system ATP-binding protein
MTLPVLQLENVERHYEQGAISLSVLRAVDFALFPSQSVALVAPSGAGKSTLLHIAGLLERPNAGVVLVGGQ